MGMEGIDEQLARLRAEREADRAQLVAQSAEIAALKASMERMLQLVAGGMLPEYMTIKEAATKQNVSRRTIERRLAKDHSLGFKTGGLRGQWRLYRDRF